MSASLESWNEQFANIDEELDKPTQFGYQFSLKTNYRLRIVNAQVLTSQRGDVQVQLDTEVLDSDDNAVGKQREWLQLPKQVSDATLPRETVVKITKSRRDNIGAILAVLDRATFGLPDPDAVTADERVQAQVSVNRAVLKYCDELHSMEGGTIDQWEGLVVNMVKAPNKKNPEYPYTNFRAEPDPKLESFGG